ncbi:GntR family transcriptional regulator [Kordiimonas pumila]|uniref:GntR family transcriptional regulator n=1 Tax=Kordiimonas pumila TaxID=2161677 RepID=A0ABV7D6V0_9PROT|nr:GntR family transcriptional regulator [Kordiimonas pumila]
MNKLDTKVSKTLADFAYQKIRRDIIRGELGASEKLRLNVLCQKYDIGMSPLREALARLIGDALVITEGQRGFWVAPLSLDEMIDITYVRSLLETEALQLSIENGDDAWRERLKQSYDALSSIESKLDGRHRDLVPEWEEANRTFHETMVSCCGSPWMIRMLQTLYQQSERYRRISIVNVQSERSVHDEHEAIYEAVMQGNVLKACKLTELHLRRTTDAVKKTLSLNT